jgi:hypothetical protein
LTIFTEYTFPKYRTAAFHRTIAEQLERVERGEVDRLMLLLPPRHGKSELASKRYPAWLLGRNPGRDSFLFQPRRNWLLILGATLEILSAVRNIARYLTPDWPRIAKPRANGIRLRDKADHELVLPRL